MSFQLQYLRGKRPRGAVKKTMMKWSLMKSSREELEALAEKFAAKEVPNRLRPGGIKALAFHKDRGHKILIASAAVDLIVEPISRRLGNLDFVSTNLAWSEKGELLDSFASLNCYGEAKLDRVKSWLSSQNTDEAIIYFYSDSKADLPVLEFSDIPVVVDPKRKFQKIAKKLNMPIQEWNSSEAGFVPIEPVYATDV
jgi:HAD superfamily hydrolase (TIGR01490 family)